MEGQTRLDRKMLILGAVMSVESEGTESAEGARLGLGSQETLCGSTGKEAGHRVCSCRESGFFIMCFQESTQLLPQERQMVQGEKWTHQRSLV